jgi:uncharacterized protein (TIGR00255 family)
MTGFGRGEQVTETKQITIEIKAVNHRYSEVQVKLPRKYALIEEKLRRHVADALSRGKVDVFVKVEERSGVDKGMSIDRDLAVKYYEKIHELAVELALPMDLGVNGVLQLPGVLVLADTEEVSDQVWADFQPALDTALGQMIAMREFEGQKLAVDFQERLAYLETLRLSLIDLAPKVVEAYGERLRQRIQELQAEELVDQNRLAVEIALFADRASVNEELVRLDSHIHQFQSLIKTQGIGRKLDFLCQEMNREVNTIGSKGNDLEITRIVVELKSELEKLREQVQNVE